MPSSRSITNEVNSYEVEIVGIDTGIKKAQRTSPGQKIEFLQLLPDTYSITVVGQNAKGEIIVKGRNTTTVDAGSSTNATVMMSIIVKNFTDLQRAVSAGGDVYIGGNIQLTESLTIDTAVRIVSLSKASLTRTGAFPFFSVNNIGNLTLGDGMSLLTLDGCKEEEYGVYVSGGTFILNGGVTITNHNETGVYIEKNGQFTMYGGTITGNQTEGGGGGVYSKGSSFIMEDGLICNNSVIGLPRMERWGGGVVISNGTFLMNGGEIRDNTMVSEDGETKGGGVYVSLSTFAMRGGTISGNTAENPTGSGYGDGIFFKSGTLSLSDMAIVTEDNDVYLSEEKCIEVNSPLIGESPVFTITCETYTENFQVLTGSAVSTEYSKFVLSDPNWMIDSTGVIRSNNAQ